MMLLLLLVSLLLGIGGALKIDLQTPDGDNVRPLPHIWTSTGFSPELRNTTNWTWPLDLTKDENHGLAIIGSLRYGALTHVRIHWLLDFVNASEIPGDEKHVTFNFTTLDSTVAHLRRHNLRPAFELMGNPTGGTFISKIHRRRLRDLLLKMTARYQAAYGANETRLWRWETWNEPDLRQYWNQTVPAYFAYFRAVVDALRDAGLRVGGPAGIFRPRHRICWEVLDEVAKTTNPQDVLSFLSFHHKGSESADQVILGTRAVIKEIRARYPKLGNLSITNDEADPLSGWWKPREWRADVRYAAMVVRTAGRLLDDVSFLSNDNAFLPQAPHFFTQRTLLARFRESDNSTHFFLKPVAVSLALLSLLGDKRIESTTSIDDDRLTIISGACWSDAEDFEGATIISFGDETKADFKESISVDLPLRCVGARCVDVRYTVFLLDNARTNPWRVWRDAGSPSTPETALRRRMRDAQGPYRAVASAPLTPRLSLTLRLPSVALVQVCSRRDALPRAPTNLETLQPAPGETLLLWSDQDVGTRCLLGYEVQGRSGFDGDWRTLTHGSILTQWHHAGSEQEYRVRAVDLWGRNGTFSALLRPATY
ncbi:alpha-L-iduronidase [Neocloeon triangulifer]|uniref:alpha-L-iduronidase n=1 Tax=Neocloeon triangulifer TaxID=2078957 RepID=UPI00286F28AD|nr:alpha-L-iduronidase [Neocloeon triangulifer]